MSGTAPSEDVLLRLRSACWEALRELAKKQPLEYQSGTCALRNPSTGLYGRTLEQLAASGLSLTSLSQQADVAAHWVWTIVLESYHEAIASGLLFPEMRVDGSPLNDSDAWFRFSRRGLSALRGQGDPNPFIDGEMRRVLAELTQRGTPVPRAVVALLEEAQRCIMSHCYRATVVLIGLATEEQADLLCRTTKQVIPQPQNLQVRDAWNVLGNETNFASQWKALLRVLEALKRADRGFLGGTLEAVPWAIGGMGEAIRMSRNQAAHDGDRIFSSAETVLLLKSVPSQLAALAAIEAKLRETGLVVPALT